MTLAGTGLGGLDVIVRFVADVSDINRGIGEVEGTTNRLKAWAKGAATAIGAAFVVREVGDFVNSAEEAERASNRLTQTLKQAGDKTGEWDAKAQKLAETLQYKTGVDDEQIKAAQAILATFHQVGGATGQATGLFERATEASLDLAAAGFGSADTAAKQLGKALQDPVAGVTALRRAGVTFTQAQRDQIKAMVDAGDQLGAQKLIMAEVERQVGGVAEKTATSADKMRVSWDETKEALGNALLPVLEALTPPLQSIAKFVQQNADWLVPLAAAIGLVVAAIKIWTVVQWALNTAIFASPIFWIILAIVALIAIIVLVVTHFEEVKQVAEDVWNAIKQAVSDAWEWIKQATNDAIAFVKGLWDDLVTFVKGIPDRILSALSTVFEIVSAPFRDAWQWIKDRFNELVGFFTSIPDRIGGAVSGIINTLTQPFRDAWNTIRGIADDIKGAFDDAIGFAKSLWNGFARTWNKIQIEVPGVDVPFVGEVGGFTVGLPDLPILGSGGIVTDATLALLGESGPEAVIPLDRLDLGGNNNYYITVNVPPTVNVAEVGAATVDAIREYERINTASWRS